MKGFMKFDKVLVVFLVIIALVLATAVGFVSYFTVMSDNTTNAGNRIDNTTWVFNKDAKTFNDGTNEQTIEEHTQLAFTAVTDTEKAEVGSIIAYDNGEGIVLGMVTDNSDGYQVVLSDGTSPGKITSPIGVLKPTTLANRVYGEITYWTAIHPIVKWVVIGLLAFLLIYQFIVIFIAFKAGAHAQPEKSAAAADPVNAWAGADDDYAGESDNIIYEENNYYYGDAATDEPVYGDDYDDVPIDEEAEMPYEFGQNGLSTTGSMEAFVYAELRKRELEVEGERKKREIEVDAEMKRRSMELDAEKKHREMELELEKKRLEIEREVKLRKIEADREIARANAMAASFNPYFVQQQQTPVNNTRDDEYWNRERELDRERDARFEDDRKREAEDRAKREAALDQERRRIEEDLLKKEEELLERTKEAEEAKLKAEKAAEAAQNAAASAAASAAQGGHGGGIPEGEGFEVNVIVAEALKDKEFETVPGITEYKIPAASNFNYTADDVYKYAESKKGVLVKPAVGKKPTTFQVGGKSKSFLLLYRYEDHFKITFKCGTAYASKISEIYTEIFKSKFPYGIYWFAIEPADSVGFEVLQTLIDISYEIALRDY